MAPSAARRDWLSECVSREPDMSVAGTASTFAFLRALMLQTSADIALIELTSQMPAAISRDWLLELLDLTVVVLLTETDSAFFPLIRRAGSGGLLQANASSDQIVQAIKSAAAGLMVIDPVLVSSTSENESLAEHLTARESEVLQLLADGLGNKDIAQRLSISEHTIKFHIRSILGKLGAASRTEAVTRGLRSGLIEL
jgi:two-component system, NarL family, response regulator YdfI